VKTERLRIGIVGGGFITQVMHLPTLLGLADHFEIVGLADPSQVTRETLAARYGIPTTCDDHEELLSATNPDALIVLSPGSTHAEVIMASLKAGKHVFTEKPLCLVAEDAWQISSAAEAAGLVVQVGYMKRYDPAYEQLLTELSSHAGEGLRLIDCVTYDPGLERFFAPAAMAGAEDIPSAFKATARDREAEQAKRAVGAASPAEIRMYVQVLCDTLVHDVNILTGALSALNEPALKALETAWWAEDHVLSSSLELSSGARCRLSLLELPGLQDFREELRIYFDDAVHVLRFPAPYVRHAPTIYERTTSRKDRSHTERWESWTESFIAELIHFHGCVRGEQTCRTPPAQAAQDLELLAEIFGARKSASQSQTA
jgi:predicted dehydrogenase